MIRTGLTRELPREDAYLINLLMWDFPRHEYWRTDVRRLCRVGGSRDE
jgi:hypothetical protein